MSFMKMKNLDVLDIGLIKIAVLLITIVIVKLLPQLLDINYSILIISAIIVGARPAYKFWIMKQSQSCVITSA